MNKIIKAVNVGRIVLVTVKTYVEYRLFFRKYKPVEL